jgi:DTW domain-containing protein YfiP
MITHKRCYCSACEFPLKTYVCSAVSRVDVPIDIIVIQHHKEAKHAKNTVRLAKLITPSIQVLNDVCVASIYERLNALDINTTLVLYPTLASVSLESVKTKNFNVKTLILLDGTWKQVHAIWQKFTHLRRFQAVEFKVAHQSQYLIRKAKKINHLSSLEAPAYALSSICDTDTTPYYRGLEAVKNNWLAHSNLHIDEPSESQ